MSNPKLRFRREDGAEFPEWEEKRLKKISDIYDGTHQTPQYVNKGIPFVSVEDINDLAHTSKFISESEYNTYKIKPQVNDIFMTRITAGVIGATAVVKSNNPMGYYVSLALLRPNNKMIISEYLSQFIGSYYFRKELHKRIIHTAFPKKINKEDIGKCNTVYPCLEEQQKIADFLSSVDEIIAQSEAEVSNLQQQKKAAMQKIFSQEVRFKREDGTEFPEWEDLTMNKVFTEIIEKNRPDLPVLSILQGQGTVYRDSSDRNIMYDKKNTANYKAIKKGDFIIHLRTFEGGLECATLDGISSPAYKILRTNKLIPEAYKDYFRSKSFIAGRLAISVTGVRDGKNIEMSTFWQIPIPVPCLEEQQKIADFLSSYDEAIGYAKQELDKWKELKKGLLQQMFV